MSFASASYMSGGLNRMLSFHRQKSDNDPGKGTSPEEMEATVDSIFPPKSSPSKSENTARDGEQNEAKSKSAKSFFPNLAEILGRSLFIKNKRSGLSTFAAPPAEVSASPDALPSDPEELEAGSSKNSSHAVKKAFHSMSRRFRQSFSKTKEKNPVNSNEELSDSITISSLVGIDQSNQGDLIPPSSLSLPHSLSSSFLNLAAKDEESSLLEPYQRDAGTLSGDVNTILKIEGGKPRAGSINSLSSLYSDVSATDIEDESQELFSQLGVDDLELPDEDEEELQSIFEAVRNKKSQWDYMLPRATDVHTTQVGHTVIPSRQRNILIMTIGSRGDVQPFVALGRGLIKEGYRVRIAAFDCFRGFVESNGIDFFPLYGDPKLLMKLCSGNEMFSMAFLVEAFKNFRVFYKKLLKSAWNACTVPSENEIKYFPDLIIGNPPVAAHYHCAEALKIPVIIGFTMPWSRTRFFPHPMIADRGMDPGVSSKNYRGYKMLEKVTWLGTMDIINRWRSKYLKLPKVSFYEGAHALHVHHIPHIYGYSRHLLPKPKDWPQYCHITNFWFLDESKTDQAWEAPAELVHFIQHPKGKPVYIGFGSIVVDDPDALTKLIIDAVLESGARAIISKGWGGISYEETHENIFFIEACPHDWLFPQCSAVFHHGGAGTLAAGLKAGCPTGIVSFFGDQFFWGSIVDQIKCGAFTSIKRLTKEWFLTNIKLLTKPEFQSQVSYISEKINSVDGVKEAVDIINHYICADISGFDRQTEVVWEFQRKYPVKGWSDRMLIPTDLQALRSGQNDERIRRDIEDVVLRPGWEWESNWMVDASESSGDPDGYSYSSVGFNGPWHDCIQPADKFRRRCIFRLCGRYNYHQQLLKHGVKESMGINGRTLELNKSLHSSQNNPSITVNETPAHDL